MVTLDQLLEVVRNYVRDHLPGEVPVELRIKLASKRKIEHPVLGSPVTSSQPEESTEDEWEPFVPSDFQEAILKALDGKNLRTDALGAAVNDRGRLFNKNDGLKELQDRGLVKHHKRLGYYRPDAPPPKLADKLDSN